MRSTVKVSPRVLDSAASVCGGVGSGAAAGLGNGSDSAGTDWVTGVIDATCFVFETGVTCIIFGADVDSTCSGREVGSGAVSGSGIGCETLAVRLGDAELDDAATEGGSVSIGSPATSLGGTDSTTVSDGSGALATGRSGGSSGSSASSGVV